MAIVMKYHLLMSNLVYIAEVRPKFSALHFCYFLQRSQLTTFIYFLDPYFKRHLKLNLLNGRAVKKTHVLFTYLFYRSQYK